MDLMPRTKNVRARGYTFGGRSHPTFKVLSQLPTSDALTQSVTINNTTVNPTFYYHAKNATAATFVASVGTNVPVYGTGAAPSPGNITPFYGANDTSVLFSAAKYYLLDASLCTAYNLGLNDILFECVGQQNVFDDTNNRGLISKRGGGNGYAVGLYKTQLYWLFMDNSVAYNLVANHSQRSWFHMVVAIDRDDNSATGGRMYLNGVLATNANYNALANVTLSSTANFEIGNHSTSLLGTNARFMQAALWLSNGWFDKTDSYAGINAWVANRFRALTGQLPTIALGTSAPTASLVRAVNKMQRKTVGGKIYWTFNGLNMPCWANVNGVTGLSIEPARTNLVTYTDMSVAQWTKVNAAISGATGFDGPENYLDMRGLVGDNTENLHGATHAPTLTATNHCISVVARPGDKNWLFLSDNTVANATAYFDVANGVIGTLGAGVIKAWMDGPVNPAGYRCCICVLGTAAAHTVGVYAADADGDNSFTGDASTVNLYVSHPQVEAGSYMTSFIQTSGGALARAADTPPVYKGDDGNLGGIGSDLQGAIRCKVMLPDHDAAACTLMSLSDGASAADAINVTCAADDTLTATSAATAGSAGSAAGATDIADGNYHRVGVRWKTNLLRVTTDGATGTDDVDVGIPDDLDTIKLAAVDGTGQHGGLIWDVECYRKRSV